MNTSTHDAISPASSEDEFVPPPPPPPRILLLRGSCLAKVLEFLGENDRACAVQCCKLLRDAADEFEDVNLIDDPLIREDDVNASNEVNNLASLPPSPSVVPVTPPSTRNKMIVAVPPGKLGIRLENKPSEMGTMVTLVGAGSPLDGKVFVGDCIVEVNGVNVESMDTYGILEVFQKCQNEERFVTIIRHNADSVISPDESIASAAEIMTPAIDNRKAARGLTLSYDICEPTTSPSREEETFVAESDNTWDVTDALNVTSICSNQSKTIMRANSTASNATTVDNAFLPTTQYHVPTTVPSNDSDLQLESLDLNSYESCNISPLTPAVSPGVVSIDQPIVPRIFGKRDSDAIPFDELDTNARLPDFPGSTVEPSFVVSDATDTEAGETVTNLGSVVSAYEDDDTITSATSSYFSSIGTDEKSYMEEQAGYLSQFADAAMFGDITLFTSLVNEIIDSAKHAAKLVVTEKGDPIDDQGPIKIGDNYYTHREAILKWKKARDKLKESKYKDNDEKLQRKLEKAAMDAAQLMAATKTFDLAARRSGRHMEKKENKQAMKKALTKSGQRVELGNHKVKAIRNMNGASTWEREELEGMRCREVEKQTKKESEEDPSAYSIHQLVNQFSLFGFPLGVEAQNGLETAEKTSNRLTSSNATPTRSRFDFLTEPSESNEESPCPEEDIMEESALKNQMFQYLTRSVEEEEEEPFDCVADTSVEASNTGGDAVQIDVLETCNEHVHGTNACGQNNVETKESSVQEDTDVFQSEEEKEAEDNADETNERQEQEEEFEISIANSVANTNTTNSSSVTEWAGSETKNIDELQEYECANQTDWRSSSSDLVELSSAKNMIHQNQKDYADETPVEAHHDHVVLDCEEKAGVDQLHSVCHGSNDVAISVESNASNDTTVSCTQDNSSAASDESTEVAYHGVEVQSIYSRDHSGILSDAGTLDQSDFQSGYCNYTGSNASESLHSSSQPRALTNISPKIMNSKGLDNQPITILEEAVCFLLDACPGELQECPSAHSKNSLDSMIGSEHGTEIIFNAQEMNSNFSPTSVHQLEKVVTERKPRISSNQSKSVVTPSPTKKSKATLPNKPKRMNPLKLIKKTSSRQTTPTEDI